MATTSQNTPSNDKGVSTESGAANPLKVDAKELGGNFAKTASEVQKLYLPDERLQRIAYEIALQFNNYDLGFGEAEQVAKYIHTRILPYQRSRIFKEIGPTAFRVVIPESLQESH